MSSISPHRVLCRSNFDDLLLDDKMPLHEHAKGLLPKNDVLWLDLGTVQISTTPPSFLLSIGMATGGRSDIVMM